MSVARRIVVKAWRLADLLFWLPLGTNGASGDALRDVLDSNFMFVDDWECAFGGRMPFRTFARLAARGVWDDLRLAGRLLRDVGGNSSWIYNLADPFMLFITLPVLLALSGQVIGGGIGAVVAFGAAGAIWMRLVFRLRADANRTGESSQRDARFTLPNFLSAARLLATIFFPYVMVHHGTRPAAVYLAALVTTDWADGFIARHYGLETRIGTMLDPAVDRFVVIVAMVMAVLHGDVWLVVGLAHLTRELIALGFGWMLFRPQVRNGEPRAKVHPIGKLGFGVTSIALVGLLGAPAGWSFVVVPTMNVVLVAALGCSAWALCHYTAQAVDEAVNAQEVVA